MRLDTYGRVLGMLGPTGVVLTAAALAFFTYSLAQRASASTKSAVVTIAYSVFYFIASPTAIIVNKMLMKDYGFHYPVMVSGLGQATTAIASAVAVHVFRLAKLEASRALSPRTLLLIGLSTALSLVLGQYPYLYLSVAFIQMLKALSPLYMVLFLFLLGIETPSRRIVATVVCLSACTAVASAGEVNFNLVGVAFMVSASGTDALRLVLAQRLLTNLKMEPFESLYVVSPICVLWMLPAAIALELPTALRNGSFAILAQHPLMVVAGGVSGFLVNVSSFLLVKRTSSMTLKTMTMARNGGLVLVSALIFGESVSTLEAIGYSGLLAAFGAYTYFKFTEADRARPTEAGWPAMKALITPSLSTSPMPGNRRPILGEELTRALESERLR